MNTAGTISDIKIVNYAPKFTDPTLLALMPTRLHSEFMSFTMLGPDAVANGLRRTIIEELPVMRLYCDYEEIITDDLFIIREMIIKRLRSVPIDQLTPKNSRFELVATNSDLIERDVKMSEFKGGRLPFNGTSTLCTLKPGKSMRISARMIEGFGYVNGEGMYSLGFNAASVALDVIPLNTFERRAPDDPTPVGVPSRLADPRKWNIKFTTNGELPCRDIVVRACESIIARSAAVKSLLYSIEFDGSTYTLSIPGESHTIGNLFMRVIHDLYPDITITYNHDNIERECKLFIRGVEDINAVFDAAIRNIEAVYRSAAAAIRK